MDKRLEDWTAKAGKSSRRSVRVASGMPPAGSSFQGGEASELRSDWQAKACPTTDKTEPYPTRLREGMNGWQYTLSPLFGGMTRHSVRIHAQMAVVPAGGRRASCGHPQRVRGGEPDRKGAGAHPGLYYAGARQRRPYRVCPHEYLWHVRIRRPAGRRVPDPCRAARLHDGAVRPEELAGGRPAGGAGAGPVHLPEH